LEDNDVGPYARSLLSKKILTFDEKNGEIRILGRRLAAIDIADLCRHMDTLVGVRVGETIMSSHLRQSGQEDVAKVRELHPQATPREILDVLIDGDLVQGIGVTKIDFTENMPRSVAFAILNPIVHATEGSALSFVLSYWEGALGSVFNMSFQGRDVSYDSKINVLHCNFVRI